MESQNVFVKKPRKNIVKPTFLKKDYWIKKFINTKIGVIPVIFDSLNFKDKFGEIKARLGINRNNYKVAPGIYAIGNPDENSQVLVTANYKLTFDKLRKELSEMSLWIVVLDTKGINVWCAAGKGTFGTEELIKRVKLTKIKELINHNTIILPQLGAPGINQQKVIKETGLKIKYGPVYAKDIKKYIENNFEKSNEMKKINFNIVDRVILTPIELNATIIPNLIIISVLFVLNLISQRNFSNKFIFDYLPFLFASVTGGFLFPILLPFLPSRSFAIKGAFLGLIYIIIVSLTGRNSIIFYLTNFLLYVPFISFLALNFTGSTTFTSLSGVKKEIKIATPIYIVSAIIGVVLKILEIFKIFKETV